MKQKYTEEDFLRYAREAGVLDQFSAADLATAQGIDVVITNGKNPRILYDVAAGNPVGTLFVGRKARY